MKTLIVGGGAAGLMAACRIARAGGGARVLEAQSRVGRKLLSTGNGRCNFTNMGARAGNYFGAREHVRAALDICPPTRVAAALYKLGVPAVVDIEDRAYPASNQAASVLDALRYAVMEAGGEIITGFSVASIAYDAAFTVISDIGQRVSGDNAIIATGGLAAPQLGASGEFLNALTAFGHKITKRLPALAPLIADAPRSLKGQRAKCAISLFDGDNHIKTETGEVIFTDYGVSGIAVMQLARYVHALAAPRLEIDFAPLENDVVARRMQLLPKRPAEDFLNGVVSRLIGISVMRVAGVSDLKAPLPRTAVAAVERALKRFPIKIDGVCGFERAQVTAGGIDMSDFDINTLESRRVRGLYAVGEACDVDGECGGYNLQWAFSSAIIAADAIISKL